MLDNEGAHRLARLIQSLASATRENRIKWRSNRNKFEGGYSFTASTPNFTVILSDHETGGASIRLQDESGSDMLDHSSALDPEWVPLNTSLHKLLKLVSEKTLKVNEFIDNAIRDIDRLL